MSILFGKTTRNKMPVPLIVDKLSIHCCAINRLIDKCVLDRDYNTAISLLKAEIEVIQGRIDDCIMKDDITKDDVMNAIDKQLNDVLSK